MVAQLALGNVSWCIPVEISCTYKAAIPSINMTETLTLNFICTFHSRIAGIIAMAKSLIISTTEKKKLISVSNFVLHVPLGCSLHSVSIGWQILRMTTQKMNAAARHKATMIQMAHT
jgi:hypothetical protein